MMKNVVLDGAEINSRAEAHDRLKQAFGFPDHYGANLDALWDLLSTYQDVVICVNNCQQLCTKLGGYGNALLDLLGEASAENERIRLVLCD